MPAEAVALGWLNEIDALGAIRHRIADATKLTGWDVFTFHTRHNLDPFYASTISAVRETWLHEGGLKQSSIAETVKRYGAAYHYNCIPARLVENLVFQSSLMGWLSTRAGDIPLRYHVLGTGLLSALVWCGSLSFEGAVRTAEKMGSRWDDAVASLAAEELEKSGRQRTDENLGWLHFHRVREILEGRSVVSMAATSKDVPSVEAPSRPFWFSPIASDEPVLLETVRDVQWALESMNLGVVVSESSSSSSDGHCRREGLACKSTASDGLNLPLERLQLPARNSGFDPAVPGSYRRDGPPPHAGSAANGSSSNERGSGGTLTAVQNKGHWPLIDQFDVHICLKDARRHTNT